MKPITPGSTRSLGSVRLVALLFMLGGCGGGVDSGGTGATSTYANGPINGFGSIIVNGVRFDDSASNVAITDADGQPRTRTDLKLGSVIEVRGSAITTDVLGEAISTASSIAIGSEIVGPIDSIATNSLIVLGRPIDVQPTTVFADDLSNGLAALAPGEVVEVHGLYNSSADRFTATRIERKANPANYRVRGKISGLTPTVFSIGPLLIDYASIPLAELPSGLANQAVVQVRLNTTFGNNGAWIANRIKVGLSRPDNGQESKVEGLIDSLTSQTAFSVGGMPVSRNSQTLVDPPGSDFSVGDRVEVEGTFISGTLVARQIELELDSGDDFDFRGAVSAVNPPTQTLTIHGVSIGYGNNPEFIRGDANALVPGANVRIRAVLVSGTQLQATRIEFR